MIERLYVDNFRSLVNFECRFDRTQLILGSNGSGKSTLFDVLSLLRDFSIWGLPSERYFGVATRTRWQNVLEQTFELDVGGNGGLYTLRLIVDTWGNPARPRVVKEEVMYSGKPIFRFVQGDVHLYNDAHEDKVQYPFDWHRSALATVTARPENTKLTWFKKCLESLLFVRPDPHQMSFLTDKEAAVPTQNLSNFASWYRHLRLESDDYELMRDLREVIPGLESMDLRDAGLGNRFLTLTFSVDDPTHHAKQRYDQSFVDLSDGQRVLIGLYTVLYFAAKPGAILCFDEPDNFIALKEIQPWLSKTLERADDDQANVQVLIISHHPELLNQLAFRHGMLLDRPGGRHTRFQRFGDPMQTGLTPAELAARGWE